MSSPSDDLTVNTPSASAPPPAGADDATLSGPVPAGRSGVRTVSSPAIPSAPPGYVIERELGRGGMGVVYLARQIGLNRPVALKMVLAGGYAGPEELVRFLAEAEAIAQLRHANVVQIYEVGTHAGQPYFTLEYCGGGALDGKLGGDPMVSGEAARLVEAVARGVQAAHAAGIIHRDLKPHNVLLAADGTPKVTDFGLAKRLGSGSDLTQTGAVLGTPSYMAPEQAAGKGKGVTPAADVYALGAILYELLTGRPPFKAATPLDTLLLVLSAEPVAPRQLNPRVPADLETITLKCLHKHPARRYPTAGELADDLKRFQAGEPILARPVSALERGWRWVRRNPLLAGVVVGVPALLAVTTVVVLVALLMTASANVQLAAAQQKAENERGEADRQRELAEARLEKAIEAVDRMMTRVSGERWAVDPALQDERRQVLEEAVEFFKGFSAEDSADPRVRAEGAKAYSRVAAAYMMLGELGKAEAAAGESARLYEGLMAEFPEDPDHPAAASEVYSLVGGAAALSARYPDALQGYTRAVELADAAHERHPGEMRYKLRAVEARSMLGYFYLQEDRAKGKALLGEMMQLGRETGGRPDAPYEHRVALAFALTVAAAYDQTAGERPPAERFAAAAAKYDEADRLLAGLEGQAAPSVRVRNQYGHTRAMVAVQRGLVATFRATTADERRAAAADIRTGIGLLDDLLRVNPKAFPYQYQKYSALRSLASVRQSLGEPDEAARYHADADRLIGELQKDHPHLRWLRALDVVRQSVLLVERVRGDRAVAFADDAEELLAVANPNNKPVVTYNVACAYAVAAGSRPANADKHAKRAVSLLEELAATRYFALPQRVASLDKDPDLDSLRGRVDYKAFREQLKPPLVPR